MQFNSVQEFIKPKQLTVAILHLASFTLYDVVKTDLELLNPTKIITSSFSKSIALGEQYALENNIPIIKLPNTHRAYEDVIYNWQQLNADITLVYYEGTAVALGAVINHCIANALPVIVRKYSTQIVMEN